VLIVIPSILNASSVYTSLNKSIERIAFYPK
jgi:hypothetical protein